MTMKQALSGDIRVHTSVNEQQEELYDLLRLLGSLNFPTVTQEIFFAWSL